MPYNVRNLSEECEEMFRRSTCVGTKYCFTLSQSARILKPKLTSNCYRILLMAGDLDARKVATGVVDC
jgi:hypothetical protein